MPLSGAEEEEVGGELVVDRLVATLAFRNLRGHPEGGDQVVSAEDRLTNTPVRVSRKTLLVFLRGFLGDRVKADFRTL